MAAGMVFMWICGQKQEAEPLPSHLPSHNQVKAKDRGKPPQSSASNAHLLEWRRKASLPRPGGTYDAFQMQQTETPGPHPWLQRSQYG